MLRPRHPLYRLWELLFTGLVMTSSLLVLYMVTFDSVSLWLHVVLYVCDAANLMNVAATCWLAYEDDKGMLVTDTTLIRRRYRRSYLLVDVFSAIPFEVFSIWYPAASPFMRVNRICHAYQILFFFGNTILMYSCTSSTLGNIMRT